MKMPNSRSKPRRLFSRVVRVASQVDRRRCNEATAWCSMVLTGTGESRRSDSLRAAVSHLPGPLDARWQPETQTLRDRQRWSYAPCGLLLALAFNEADSPLAQ